LSREWKRDGVMDGESGELTEWEEVVGAWTGRTETQGFKWGWRRELGSWFQRQWMTLNGVMALFCIISANSGSFRAHCVKVHVRCLISWWVVVSLCQLTSLTIHNSLSLSLPTQDLPHSQTFWSRTDSTDFITDRLFWASRFLFLVSSLLFLRLVWFRAED